MRISEHLEDNIKELKKRFNNCDDIVQREMMVADLPMYIVYVDSMIDRELVEGDFLKNLMYGLEEIPKKNTFDFLQKQAMTTADTVLVPIQCEYYALEGLSQLIHTINLVQERLNPNLQIEGVVFTMYDIRTKLSNQVVENVKENLDTKIYNTMIPRNIRLAEAPSYGIPINMYDSKSAGAESYRKLAKEIVDREDL